jgi:hypothetical protein
VGSELVEHFVDGLPVRDAFVIDRLTERAEVADVNASVVYEHLRNHAIPATRAHQEPDAGVWPEGQKTCLSGPFVRAPRVGIEPTTLRVNSCPEGRAPRANGSVEPNSVCR